MKEELFNCQKGYFGEVERNVLLAKIKADEALHRARAALPPAALPPTPPELALLAALKKRLGGLNSGTDHLLREGILTLYMELCELREKAGRAKVRRAVEAVLRTIVEIVAGLLKPFFIYQEYHRCRSSPSPEQRKKNILSLRNLNSAAPAPAAFDEKLMREVEDALTHKPVGELLEAFMRYCCWHSGRRCAR